MDMPWGGGMVSVYGDYDGDGLCDLVYNPQSGAWYVRSLDGRVLVWGIAWADQPLAVPGDRWRRVYDLAVYEPATGRWFVSVRLAMLLNRNVWGGPGFEPVIDYNGDKLADLAFTAG